MEMQAESYGSSTALGTVPWGARCSGGVRNRKFRMDKDGFGGFAVQEPTTVCSVRFAE